MEKLHFKNYILLTITVLSLTFAAYAYGRLGAKHSETRPPQLVPRVVIGTITKTKPFHIFLKGVGVDNGREFDILVDAHTSYAQLVPWGPGEKEQAQKDYNERLSHMRLKNGDPISSPPQEAQLKPWLLDNSSIGTMVGVEIAPSVKSGEPLLARGIRPLTENEIENKAPNPRFPW